MLYKQPQRHPSSRDMMWAHRVCVQLSADHPGHARSTGWSPASHHLCRSSPVFSHTPRSRLEVGGSAGSSCRETPVSGNPRESGCPGAAVPSQAHFPARTGRHPGKDMPGTRDPECREAASGDQQSRAVIRPVRGLEEGTSRPRRTPARTSLALRRGCRPGRRGLPSSR